jgi:coatomer subunit delta
MESHEEKLHQMIQQSKMESAKDQANIAAKNIRERQREQQRLGVGSSMQGIGSNNNTSAEDLSVTAGGSIDYFLDTTRV